MRFTYKRSVGAAGVLLAGTAGVVAFMVGGVAPQASAESGYRVCGVAGTGGVFLAKVGKDDHKACQRFVDRAETYAGTALFTYHTQTCESITNQHFYGLYNGDVCTGSPMLKNQLYEVGVAGEILHAI